MGPVIISPDEYETYKRLMDEKLPTIIFSEEDTTVKNATLPV